MGKDKSLPSHPVVGDRIKLKSERITEYTDACKLAGYSTFDAYATHEVIRVDQYAPGGGNRLFVKVPPFCFLPRDVELQMTDAERREMLLGHGWRHDRTRGTWSSPR